MEQIMVPLGGAEGMERRALLPAVLEHGKIDIFIILEYVKFIAVCFLHMENPRVVEVSAVYIKMIPHHAKNVYRFHIGI